MTTQPTPDPLDELLFDAAQRIHDLYSTWGVANYTRKQNAYISERYDNSAHKAKLPDDLAAEEAARAALIAEVRALTGSTRPQTPVLLTPPDSADPAVDPRDRLIRMMQEHVVNTYPHVQDPENIQTRHTLSWFWSCMTANGFDPWSAIHPTPTPPPPPPTQEPAGDPPPAP